MDNTFNFKRFGLLLKRQWLEFGRIYLISLLVALGVIVTFYSFSLWSDLILEKQYSRRDLNFREPLFLIFGFLFITVIASSYFNNMGQKPKAIIELMIPASTFEKFLAGVFFTGLLNTLSFLLIFHLVDLAFVMKLEAITGIKSQEELMYLYKYIWHIPGFVFLIPFFVTSIFLLGSIYFNKFHYIKTAISVMIFSGIWTYIVMNTTEYLMKGRVPVGQRNWNDGRQDVQIWITVVLAVLTLIFWAITYVRLKEKEV